MPFLKAGLKLLPALLALLIPYFTAGQQDLGPYIGAGWLKAHPSRWAGETVAVLIYRPGDAGLPAPGGTLPVASLQSRRPSLGHRLTLVHGRVSPDALLLTVEDANWASDPSRGAFALQLAFGGSLLVMLIAAGIERHPRGTWRLRSWIR